jgi:tetrahydrodipicolinate N-acetyltransferase
MTTSSNQETSTPLQPWIELRELPKALQLEPSRVEQRPADVGKHRRLKTQDFVNATHIALVKTLYMSVRCRGWCVVLRGTHLKLRRGASIRLAEGARLTLGTRHTSAVPCSVHLRRGACLSISGRVELTRGTRVLLREHSKLEIGPGSYVSYDSTITCFNHIAIGANCAISWNTNILDGNAHDLIVEGETRPRSKSVSIGDHVWIGTGAVILGGVTIGDGAVVGAGSVVSSDVPAHALVAGNPARVLRRDVSWVD